MVKGLICSIVVRGIETEDTELAELAADVASPAIWMSTAEVLLVYRYRPLSALSALSAESC